MFKIFKLKMKFCFYDKNKLSLTLFIIILCLKFSNSVKSSNADKQILEKEKFLKKTSLRMSSYENTKKIPSSRVNTFNYSHLLQLSPAGNEDKQTSFFEKLSKLFGLYFKFFIIFAIIAFLKWYEEMLKIKINYVENKYSMFQDLTAPQNKNKDLSEFEGQYVFTSGPTQILAEAQDNIFKFSSSKKYAAVERKVEFFHINNYTWNRIGYIDNKEDSCVDSNSIEKELYDVTFPNSNYMQINLTGEIYTFPRVISSLFLGHVKFYKYLNI